MTVVLAIDDEQNNLDIIKMDLEDRQFKVLCARSGHQGLELLQKNKTVDAILLDRMMPQMDGMAFMKKLKAYPQWEHVPVIMQTAAVQKQQIIEGIQSGVYYYLTKPYELEVLFSIIEAAIRDCAYYHRLQQRVDAYSFPLQLLKSAHFDIQNLNEVPCLANFLSASFPEPANAMLGISELLINAIEHGNLGITYQEKTHLLSQGVWRKEVERRLQLPVNREKKVHIEFYRTTNRITLVVQDQGEGFDWREYLEFSPERAMDIHGRGIAMTRLISFDKINYLGRGNVVTCIKLLQ